MLSLFAERKRLFGLVNTQIRALRPLPPPHCKFAAPFVILWLSVTPGRDKTQAPNDNSVEKLIIYQRANLAFENLFIRNIYMGEYCIQEPYTSVLVKEYQSARQRESIRLLLHILVQNDGITLCS